MDSNTLLLFFGTLLGGGGLATFVTVWATRKKDKSSDAQERFAQNIELSKYIDGKIETATVPLKLQIDQMRSEIEALKERENTTKNILRGWFQRLVFWNQNGRPGPMPMPSKDDMERLDLDDLDTDIMVATRQAN